jgi:AbrB family looped-hinge helix DNA binding protein
MSSTMTVSSKYQIVIPKELRERLNIKPGQKLVGLVKFGHITLVPVRPIAELRGFAPGADTSNYRDEEDDV